MRGNGRKFIRRGKVSLPMLARAIPGRRYQVARLDSLLYSAARGKPRGKTSSTSSESPWG